MPAIVRYLRPRVLFHFWLEGTQIYVTVPWGGVTVCHYEEVVVNSICWSGWRTGLAGDRVLDVERTLDHLKVSPSGFPFFQSFYALTNGETGEQRVVETCSPDTDKVSQELRMTDSIIELSAIRTSLGRERRGGVIGDGFEEALTDSINLNSLNLCDRKA
jgi:hypothetical protein